MWYHTIGTMWISSWARLRIWFSIKKKLLKNLCILLCFNKKNTGKFIDFDVIITPGIVKLCSNVSIPRFYVFWCIKRRFCDTLKQDNYDWNCTLLFNFEKVDKQNLIRQKAVIKLSRSSYFYNSFIICPSVTVRNKKKPHHKLKIYTTPYQYARGRRTIIKKRFFILNLFIMHYVISFKKWC